MSSPASIARHPLHPMLVVFPSALWPASLACDALFLATGDPSWNRAALWAIVGGLGGALAAAVPGALDYSAIRAPKALSVATTHLTLNLGAIALFLLGAWLRWAGDPPDVPTLAVSAGAMVLVAMSGWLGGELVYVHGLGVDRAASTPPRRTRARERRGARKSA